MSLRYEFSRATETLLLSREVGHRDHPVHKLNHLAGVTKSLITSLLSLTRELL